MGPRVNPDVNKLQEQLDLMNKLYQRELTRRRQFHRAVIQQTGFDAGAAQPDFMPIQIQYAQQPQGTYVVCGSMLGGDMITKLEFVGTLSDTNCHRVFIKDFYKSWYQDGLMGLTENRNDTIGFLRSLLENFPRPLTFVGSSSGGYAALLFGHALDAERIVTFGAQTLLTRNIVAAYGDSRVSSFRFDYNLPENDLRKILIERPLTGQAELHFAARNRLDARQHQYVADLPNVTTISHDIRMHAVAVRLRAQGKLKDAIVPPEILI